MGTRHKPYAAYANETGGCAVLCRVHHVPLLVALRFSAHKKDQARGCGQLSSHLIILEQELRSVPKGCFISSWHKLYDAECPGFILPYYRRYCKKPSNMDFALRKVQYSRSTPTLRSMKECIMESGLVVHGKICW